MRFVPREWGLVETFYPAPFYSTFTTLSQSLSNAYSHTFSTHFVKYWKHNFTVSFLQIFDAHTLACKVLGRTLIRKSWPLFLITQFSTHVEHTFGRAIFLGKTLIHNKLFWGILRKVMTTNFVSLLSTFFPFPRQADN